MRVCFKFCLIGSLFVFSALSELATDCQLLAANPTQRNKLQSQALLDEALHHESLGLNSERAKLLRDASTLYPHHDTVHWAQGKVRYRHQWVDANEIPAHVEEEDAFTRYRELRADCASTPEAQFTLATWCGKHGLPLQQQAHLERVIELQPGHLA
ncbi:MAG TPA: hypothetical protein VL096_08755, partial [Pirellulaceae bacterium]|nr:hypothetical protein [Pirellulaceae bacterium]